MTSARPGQVLFAFVRHWSRRSPDGDPAVAEHGRLVLVTEAVHALTQRGIAATVSTVAREIGIDQSGASRLVKVATEAGYVTVQASEADGRIRQATVTPSGHALLEHAHEWQERVFDELTQGWGEQRRRGFQEAMSELMHRSHAFDA